MKNRNIISKIKRSKVTDYAALNTSISYIPSMSLHPNQYLIATGQLHGKEPEHSVSGCFEKLFYLV